MKDSKEKAHRFDLKQKYYTVVQTQFLSSKLYTVSLFDCGQCRIAGFFEGYDLPKLPIIKYCVMIRNLHFTYSAKEYLKHTTRVSFLFRVSSMN